MLKKRELKFRIWDKKQKKMIHPENNLKPGGDDFEYFLVQEFIEDVTFNFINDDIVIQQFTELLDKNSKEIYEGDIVKLSYDNEDKYYSLYVVEFKNGIFGMNWPRGFTDLNYFVNFSDGKIEIIGNIFENPQLLKK